MLCVHTGPWKTQTLRPASTALETSSSTERWLHQTSLTWSIIVIFFFATVAFLLCCLHPALCLQWKEMHQVFVIYWWKSGSCVPLVLPHILVRESVCVCVCMNWQCVGSLDIPISWYQPFLSYCKGQNFCGFIISCFRIQSLKARVWGDCTISKSSSLRCTSWILKCVLSLKWL